MVIMYDIITYNVNCTSDEKLGILQIMFGGKHNGKLYGDNLLYRNLCPVVILVQVLLAL